MLSAFSRCSAGPDICCAYKSFLLLGDLAACRYARCCAQVCRLSSARACFENSAMQSWADLDTTDFACMQAAKPAVVHVTTTQEARSMFGMNPMQIPQGSGSGFLWDSNGHVVTNWHVSDLSGCWSLHAVTGAGLAHLPTRLSGSRPHKWSAAGLRNPARVSCGLIPTNQCALKASASTTCICGMISGFFASSGCQRHAMCSRLCGAQGLPRSPYSTIRALMRSLWAQSLTRTLLCSRSGSWLAPSSCPSAWAAPAACRCG